MSILTVIIIITNCLQQD